MTFIVLEGGEGSGKSTQTKRLAAWLRDRGHSVCETFEPGDTAAGAELRERLLHSAAPLSAEEELQLVLQDRAQHVAETIRPALARGEVVVCDRFAPSSLAYQGVGRDLGVAAVERRSAELTGGLEPDLVLVLDVADDVAEARVPSNRDRMERAGTDFHARVRAAYRDLAADRGWVMVDASGTPDDVAARVRDAVSRLSL